DLEGALGWNDAFRGLEKQGIAEQRAQAAESMADGGRRKMQPLRRPADVPLLKNDLEQHKKIEINPGKVSLVQHNAEIISLDSSWREWDLGDAAGRSPAPTQMESHQYVQIEPLETPGAEGRAGDAALGQRRTGANVGKFGAGTCRSGQEDRGSRFGFHARRHGQMGQPDAHRGRFYPDAAIWR